MGGYGVVMTKIEDIVSKYSSQVVYDEINDSVRATVTIQKGDRYPVISGRTLTEGTYVFWYENEKSLTAKLQLVGKYHLKGSGSWSLGQETANTWKYYNKVVNGNDTVIDVGYKANDFYDVPSTYWAYSAIQHAQEKGWVTGRGENYFAPEETLTRAEFATLLARILGYTYQKEGDFYLDIKKHWARNDINAISLQKLMNGYQNGLFLPDQAITREEVAKVLFYLMDDISKKEVTVFKDVAKDRWSYEYIGKLGTSGIFRGYEDGYFRPQNSIKRSEMATVLVRIFGDN